MDYSKTLNLPKTDFAMRANLPQKEPMILKFWEENKIYEKSLEKIKVINPLFYMMDLPMPMEIYILDTL